MAAEAELEDAQPLDPPTVDQPTVQTPAVTPKKEPKKPAKKDAKKGKEGKGEAAPAGGPSVSGHPRAVVSIARTKSWCGLAGFLIGGYLSLPTSTFVAAGLRALIAGTVCYVAGWAAAVFVWRRLVMLEIRAREQQVVSDAIATRPALAGALAQSPGRGQSGGRDAS